MSGNKSTASSVSSIEAELYFVIARFLSHGPCKQAADVLLRELCDQELLPKGIDWKGNERIRTYDQLVQSNGHIGADYLLQLCSRVGPLLDQLVPTNIHGIRSLLGAGNLSLLRTPESIKFTKWQLRHHMALHHGCPRVPPHNLLLPSLVQSLHARTASGACGPPRTCLNSKITMHDRKLGHLSAVYCVLYDRTGNYIFTGADDALVKIWNASSGRLLATLRGHSSEITDMAVNFENTLLASGSCDKMVRVWCLKTKAPVAVLHAHTGAITTLQFSPHCRGKKRILVSTGADGCVCFWLWSVSDRTFSPKPIKFVERSHAGAQMLCSSFSPGGMFLATGNSDHVIRVYFLHATAPEPVPEKICELEAHMNKVDSMCYSNNHNRFVSGSEDGTARIWRYERQEWRAIVLNMATKLNKDGTEMVPSSTSAEKLRVTMVCWNVDDSLVMTAVSNFSVKVWDANAGKLLHVLQSHQDEVFVLEGNPVDRRIVISAGHDGHIIIWDVVAGVKIKSFFNNIQGQGFGAVYDCKFTPDGQSFSATDSHGHLLFFGFGSNDKIKQVPQEVFFHTDYRPLIRDANNFVLDEQTQQPPHLMPPPFLVNIDGNPYPPRFQRLVPGREGLVESQLVPEIGINEAGNSEVIGDGAGNPEPTPPPPQPPPEPHRRPDDDDETEDEEEAEAGLVGDQARPSIDEMIRQLQQEQDQRILAQGGEVPLASPPPPDQRRTSSSFEGRVGMRRSGETEGVRQSLGNVSQRATSSDLDAWRKRVIVKELDNGVLRASENKRTGFADEEMRKFILERKKKPSVPNTPSTLFGQMSKGKQSSAKAEPSHKEGEHEVTARNRLTTRALYDTEEEEDEEGDFDGLPSERDSEESDYSDWTMEGSSILQPPKRRSQRNPKRKRVSSSEEEDEDEENIVVDDEEEDEEDEEDEDEEDHEEYKIPLKASSKKREEPVEKSKKKVVLPKGKSQSKKPHKQKGETKKKLPQVTELKEEFRPPEWLTGTIPRKTPYVPQMGDEVMYFRQGHELYLQAVQRHKAYELNPNINLPWQKMQLREMELVKIVGIRYEVKPPRLCSLKLAFVNSETGKLLGRSFSIRYHDMPDVIDFLVLRQHFDIAYKRKWKPGDRFRSMIDDQWWMGVIKSQSPLNPQFPDSHFQSLYVHWDNGEYERLSPWDMEPINDDVVPSDVGGGVPVDNEELKCLLYTPKHGEWSSESRDVETGRILHGLEAIMEHSAAEPFNAPVDLNAFPLYAYIIEYPIDLSTIKARLENGYYRRINALQWDIRHIESNAKKFNEDGTSISRSASIVTETLLSFISDKNCWDPMPILERLSHGQQFTWNKNNSSSSDEAAGNSSGSKRKRPGAEEDEEEVGKSKHQRLEAYRDPREWKERCWELLGIMLECEDAEPFKDPVNATDYPEYYTVVETPMDFRTVGCKLQNDHYTCPLDFAKDVRLIFSNSRLYNTNKRSRIFTMTLRLSAMFEERIRKILTCWRAATKSRRQNWSSANRAETSSAAVERAKLFASRSQTGPSTSSVLPSTSGPPAAPRPQLARRATEERSRNRAASPAKKRARIAEANDSDSTEVENEDDESDDDDDEEGNTEIEDVGEEEERTAPSRRLADASDKENYHEDEDTEVEEEEEESPRPSSQRKLAAKDSCRSAVKNQRQLSNGHTKYRTRARTGSLKPKRYASSDEEEEKDTKKNGKRAASFSSRDSSLHFPDDDDEGDDSSTESSSSQSSSESDGATRRSTRKHTSHHQQKGKSRHRKSRQKSHHIDSDEEDEESDESDTDSTSESENSEEPAPRPVPRPKSRKKLDIRRERSGASSKHSSASGQRTTRYQGKRTVHYLEDSYEEDDDDPSRLSISSRGRVRKMTKRARANNYA